jgi:hypothetical protein
VKKLRKVGLSSERKGNSRSLSSDKFSVAISVWKDEPWCQGQTQEEVWP